MSTYLDRPKIQSSLTPTERVEKNIIRLLQRDEPFFATVIMNQQRVCTDQVPTMAVDGCKYFYYNPEFVETLSDDEIRGVLVHEIEHIINKHSFRRGGRDHQLWNMACDYAINKHVLENGYKLPEEGLFDTSGRFDNMSPEQIYGILDQERPKGGGGNGGVSGNPDPGGCGGVIDPQGEPKKDDKGNPLPPSPDGSNSQPMSSDERDEAEREVDQQIRQAVAIAQKAGKMSAGLARRVLAELESKVDWRDVLNRFVADFAQEDFSYRRSNRRFLASGVIMPSRWSESIGGVAMCMDTSASISEELLEQAASELLSAMEVYELCSEDPSLTCVYCDSRVAGVQVLSPGDIPEPKGGGGTRFSPAFAKVKELNDEADGDGFCGIVYITDGYCDDFGPEPAQPVLWMLTCDNDSFKPPFGEVVKL